jgi:hypothetical protein
MVCVLNNPALSVKMVFSRLAKLRAETFVPSTLPSADVSATFGLIRFPSIVYRGIRAR